MSGDRIGELLEIWRERADRHLERARELTGTIGGRLDLMEATVYETCLDELRRARVVAGELAPLPGQVLDDQTVDALDHRYAELEARVDVLERAISQ
jgi:hypothetical protein